MTISEWLKANSRSAKWLAGKVDLSAAQISRIRNGHSSTTWKTAQRISKVTGGTVRPEDLMPKEEEVSRS
jgi:plasmid maintenance system antidote protein VapI